MPIRRPARPARGAGPTTRAAPPPAAADPPSRVEVTAATAAEIPLVRQLFVEYAQSLGFSLCFQGLDRELATLPGDYAPPAGRLLIAAAGPRTSSEIVGCVALRRLAGDICEMKRLYVRPAFRGRGIGRVLVDAAIGAARTAGYRRLRLDTIPGQMAAAVALYRERGFRPIPPYTAPPTPRAQAMELELRTTRRRAP